MTVHQHIRALYSEYIRALGDRDKVLFDNLTIPEEEYAKMDDAVIDAHDKLADAIKMTTGLTMAELEKIR